MRTGLTRQPARVDEPPGQRHGRDEKKPTDNPADPFKKALAEATKVMANDPELSVSYTVDPSGLSGDAMRLPPQVSRRMTREEVLLARGTADALASSTNTTMPRPTPAMSPPGDMARDIYEAMETARCEAMGARDMPGTAGNIDAKIANDTARLGFDQITDRAEAPPLAAAAGYLVRNLATGRDLPAGARNVMELWQGFIEEQAGGTLEDLKDKLADQTEFARFARQVITDLGYGDQLGEDPDASDEDQDDQAEDSEEEENPDDTGQDESEEQTGEADPEQSQEEQQDAAEARFRWTKWLTRKWAKKRYARRRGTARPAAARTDFRRRPPRLPRLRHRV